jgi:hypothetical protein
VLEFVGVFFGQPFVEDSLLHQQLELDHQLQLLIQVQQTFNAIKQDILQLQNFQ